MKMSTPRVQFAAFSRLLHWTMAVMILTMLGIGLAMVTPTPSWVSTIAAIVQCRIRMRTVNCVREFGIVTLPYLPLPV